MGVSGHFWDLLKPYARREGFDFLRDKRVAVDLSFWIIQHETALRGAARNPHIRLTFFRTINLFSKFGAFPVFVVDGTPSPLKSQARMGRFFHGSGIDISKFQEGQGEGVSVERNGVFTKCVSEVMELLKLLGMPILKARGEAEALCAQLNSEGLVDACITADSDAFLFGAKCVIKCLYPNSKEPIECYHMSDIEAGLGLKRKQLIAISLLVGSDHDLNGVPGIGIDTALRFVQIYNEDEVLNRLHEIGYGNEPLLLDETYALDDVIPDSDACSPKAKPSHCSQCGHPGNKRSHFRISCEHCGTDATGGCIKKPEGFKCTCLHCDADQKERELKKQEQWKIKICRKIAAKHNFPNDEIIDMYLSNKHGFFHENERACLSWKSPNIDMAVDFLSYHQLWAPSFIRQRMIPLLSTNFLREMALNKSQSLLNGQYEFDSVQCVKMRFGHRFYAVKWRNVSGLREVMSGSTNLEGSSDMVQEVVMNVDDSTDPLGVLDAPQINVGGGCSYLFTEESMELVQAAFPGEVDRFLHEKEEKEWRRRKRPGSLEETSGKPETPSSGVVQPSITDFYRSTKASFEDKSVGSSGGDSSKEKKQARSGSLSKSVRRRLLFQ